MKNIYAGLLFNQGHVTDPELARSLAGAPVETDGPGPSPQGRDIARGVPADRTRRGLCATLALILPLRGR